MGVFGPLLNPPSRFQATDHGDGRVCFRFPRSRTASYTKQCLLIIDGKQIAAGYMGYTGQWYLFDVETGEEVATVRREFYEAHFAKFHWTDLVRATEDQC